jgi:hypothetical protein
MGTTHDLTVDWCWPNLANTWICLVLDWVNTWLSMLLFHSAAPRTAGYAHSQFCCSDTLCMNREDTHDANL